MMCQPRAVIMCCQPRSVMMCQPHVVVTCFQPRAVDVVLPVSYCDSDFVLMMLYIQLRAEDSQASADVDDAPTFVL
jgi:hypothetical protein